jgi:pimeloyl-ACP methyl ester carboxylesterase
VIDPTGQRVSATDRLHLAEAMPSLIVWGERDPVIPVAHALSAHKAMPGSELELLEGAGHFPQLDDPIRMARLLTGFMESTPPADVQAESLRELVLG